MQEPARARCSSVAVFLFLTFAALPLSGQGAQAQSGAQSPAVSTVPGSKTVNDGVFSEAQATRGEQVFQANCSMCHGIREFTNPDYLKVMHGSPVRTLHQVIASTMPQLTPGSLTRQQYADIVGYVLRIAGYPSGITELPTDDESLNQILFEPPRR